MDCSPPRNEVYRDVPDCPADQYFAYAGQGPWFTCAAEGEAPPRMARRGLAGPDTEAQTLPGLLRQAVELEGKRDALLAERPLPALQHDRPPPPALSRETWQRWTFEQYHWDARAVAKAFISLGLEQFGTVIVWGFNSPEWFISALAAMYVGAKFAGVYMTDPPTAAAYKVVHSGAAIVVVESHSQVKKLALELNARGDATAVKAFAAWGPGPRSMDEVVSICGSGDCQFMSWAFLMDLGRSEENDDALDARFARVKPGHCAALVYTAGATGEPKAVMLSHDNLISTTHTMHTILGRSCGLGAKREEVRILSFLPLSHVAPLMVDLCGQIIVTALRPGWQVVFFARPYDLKRGSLRDRLAIVKPTGFLGVPSIYERIADNIRAASAKQEGISRWVATWAREKASSHARRLELGGDGGVPMGLGFALRSLRHVKASVGLQECKVALTGATPMRLETMKYFSSLGIHIHETYGMSESTGIATMSTEQAHQLGSCGWPIPGLEVKVFKVDPNDVNSKTECPFASSLETTIEEYQGELCFRGRGVMMGYLACRAMGPEHLAWVERCTAQTIDADGWLHSGDKGLRTRQGMFKITGRFKELIRGAGGESIAPAPIEDFVKGSCDAIQECMLIGDGRAYPVALITLKAVGATGEVPGTDELADVGKRVSPPIATISEAMHDQKWIQLVSHIVRQANLNPKVSVHRGFRITKFTILPTNFSEQRHELTPARKLKRREVERRYATLIDAMYVVDPKVDAFYLRYEALLRSAPHLLGSEDASLTKGAQEPRPGLSSLSFLTMGSMSKLPETSSFLS